MEETREKIIPSKRIRENIPIVILLVFAVALFVYNIVGSAVVHHAIVRGYESYQQMMREGIEKELENLDASILSISILPKYEMEKGNGYKYWYSFSESYDIAIKMKDSLDAKSFRGQYNQCEELYQEINSVFTDRWVSSEFRAFLDGTAQGKKHKLAWILDRYAFLHDSNLAIVFETSKNQYEYMGSGEGFRINDEKYSGTRFENLMAGRPEDYVEPVRPKEPAIGMTTLEVRLSTWGEPRDINKTTTAYGVSEQWVYYGYRYIYFDNGIVTAISE